MELRKKTINKCAGVFGYSTVSLSLSASAANTWEDLLKPRLPPIGEYRAAMLNKLIGMPTGTFLPSCVNVDSDTPRRKSCYAVFKYCFAVFHQEHLKLGSRLSQYSFPCLLIYIINRIALLIFFI